MLVYNTSSAPITVGTVTVPANTTPATAVNIPWDYIRSDPAALAELIAGALVPVGPPGLDWNDLEVRFYPGVWLPPTTLSANTNYTLANILFTGAFATGRLYLLTSAGSATFSLEASADGGQNWSPLPDWSPVSLTTDTAVLLPSAAPLLRGTLAAGASGWTGSIQFTLQ